MTGEDCSQPPDGVTAPFAGIVDDSKCTVSPTTSPMRPTVGSPAMPATSWRRA